MTPQSPSFTAYRRRIAKSSMPLLGELVWYTVAESVKIDHAKFLKACEKHGLERYAPNVPKDVDVFRRMCTQAQRKRVPVPNTEVFENYLVRDVRSAAGHFWKQVVVETVDGQNRKLSFEPIVEIEFDPDIPDVLHTTWLGKPQNEARSVIDSILTGYTDWRGKIYGYSAREFVRAVIGSTGATVVKPSGGVYFVMSSKLDTIAKLDEIVREFAKPGPYGEDFMLHTVPLIDDARQREMLRAAVEADTAGEIDSFIKDVQEAISDNKTNDRTFAALAKRKNEIKERAEEYAVLLEDTLGGTELRLKSLEAALKRYYKAI